MVQSQRSRVRFLVEASFKSSAPFFISTFAPCSGCMWVGVLWSISGLPTSSQKLKLLGSSGWCMKPNTYYGTTEIFLPIENHGGSLSPTGPVLLWSTASSCTKCSRPKQNIMPWVKRAFHNRRFRKRKQTWVCRKQKREFQWRWHEMQLRGLQDACCGLR